MADGAVGNSTVMRSERSPRLLAAFLATAGVSHFAAPGFYDAIVPHALPGSARAWTLVSGAAELVCAAAVASRRGRREGALATVALFIAVFPANVQMAVDLSDERTAGRVLSLIRLPLQLPLIVWAWRVARGAAPPRRSDLDSRPRT